MRYYRDTDLTEYHKVMSDKVNMYYFIPFGFVTSSIEESQVSLENAIDYNASGQGYRFCIALKETDKLIGGVGYGTAPRKTYRQNAPLKGNNPQRGEKSASTR